MYQHHRDSLENLKQYFMAKEEVIAVIVGGSVAKGCERPDSDLDAMVVITPEAYQQRVESHTTVETIHGYCTYEGGYFDTKYMTKAYLQEAAQKASEPTRNSFEKSFVAYTKDPEIPGIVSRIPVFQKAERDEKMKSFYSNLWLNYHYFLKDCKPEGYMRLHACGEILYSVYRMILQEAAVLFPSNRRLEETVEKLENRPARIVEWGRRLAQEQSEAAADAFVQCYLGWTQYPLPKDMSQILSRYTADFEQWWRVPRPLIAEW